MKSVFTKFKEYFEKRFQKISILDLGEDSVRYDFFLALKEELHVSPWDMQLEHPIVGNAFAPRNDAKSKRKEKPKVDLWVDAQDQKLTFEFGIFKRNSVDNSPINDTEYAFKILNDLMRLALVKHLTKCDAYFVCVADAMMLGRQLSHKKLSAFPSRSYTFNHTELVDIMANYDSAKKIDSRFLVQLDRLNVRVIANLVFNERIVSPLNTLETRILVWEVTCN